MPKRRDAYEMLYEVLRTRDESVRNDFQSQHHSLIRREYEARIRDLQHALDALEPPTLPESALKSSKCLRAHMQLPEDQVIVMADALKKKHRVKIHRPYAERVFRTVTSLASFVTG